LASGFHEHISLEQLREDALTGKIEKRLHWLDARPGDTFFVPAGTVHAIGAGVVMCEIQQHSDVTYRLYDYGRDRELHLEKALAVTLREPSEAGRVNLPVTCAYFHTEMIEAGLYLPSADRFHLLIVLEGEGKIAGERLAAGETWLVPAGADPFQIEGGLKILRTQVPL
jgi:mannose-6-phosphate isomerase